MSRFRAIRQATVTAAFLLVAHAFYSISPVQAGMTREEKAVLAADRCNGPVIDPWNDFISVLVNAEGLFNIGAFQPDSWDLMYAWPDAPGTSFTTIRVDGADYTYGYTEAGVSFFVQPPEEVDSLTNASRWQVGDILVTQILQIVTGTTTGNPDTVKISYQVENNGIGPHEVGVRIMLDTEINYNDGAPFRVPGLSGAVDTETELFPPGIPQYYQAFFNLGDADHVAQGTLGGGGATLPERFVMASWPEISDTWWEYDVTPGKIFGSESYPDSAVALYWFPKPLSPGESLTYTTYYGIGGISGSADLSISGPAQLDVVGVQWSPNPFTVVAYLQNNTGYPLPGESLTLDLSGAAGLFLAPGETPTHDLAGMDAGVTIQTSWSVLAVAPGTWPYAVSAVSNPSMSAERSIIVPEIFAECTPGAVEACATGLYGVCAQGERTCSPDGNWGSCESIHQPSAEICADGLDNDCNGVTDQYDECAAPGLDCLGARPSPAALWPPNNKFVSVAIEGVAGAGGFPAAITVDAITQDEPVKGNKGPDASGVGTSLAGLRADRLGNGNGGRVYVVTFTAEEPGGSRCQGAVSVCVPHDRARPGCIDDGQLYDSTVAPPWPGSNRRH